MFSFLFLFAVTPMSIYRTLADFYSQKNSVCAISIYRIPKLHGLSLQDPSWSDADTTIWSVVEICVAVVCACAIVYRPLFAWVLRIRVYIATVPGTGTGTGAASVERSGLGREKERRGRG